MGRWQCLVVGGLMLAAGTARATSVMPPPPPLPKQG